MTSVVSRPVICEVDMLVAIVVTKLLVIVVENVGNGGIGLDTSLCVTPHQYASEIMRKRMIPWTNLELLSDPEDTADADENPPVDCTGTLAVIVLLVLHVSTYVGSHNVPRTSCWRRRGL